MGYVHLHCAQSRIGILLVFTSSSAGTLAKTLHSFGVPDIQGPVRPRAWIRLLSSDLDVKRLEREKVSDATL